MDRLSEAVVLFGLLWYFSDLNAREEVLLIFAAVVASIMVSYLRARAEIIGVKLREGIFTRTERVLLLGGGLILQDILDTNVLTPVLWALALISGFTVLQRLVLVWLKTRDMSDSA
jgi:CDP-diacylglycerol--glycerol-3-phosphate 3-phosphatidyltransferase